MKSVKIIIRGGGDIGSAVAWYLFKSGFRKILILEKEKPLSIRREVCFASAVYENIKKVEGIIAKKIGKDYEVFKNEGYIPVLIDEAGKSLEKFSPDVVIDAVLSKRQFREYNLDKFFVIGLGPEFVPGRNCHIAVETSRGHNLGRIFKDKPPMQPTGKPGTIAGYSEERLLRAPASGIVKNRKKIGDMIKAGNIVCFVGEMPVTAKIDGVLRGLIRDGTIAHKYLKIGDIDPRGNQEFCYTMSEKSRCIAGSVLLAIMNRFFQNQQGISL